MLEQNYNAEQVEKKWQEYWLKQGTFNFHADKNKKVFSIDTPPPTLSGNMHIGHAFSYAQQDFIARYQRMKGMNVYYPFGIDNNGLPTERMVEKLKQVKSVKMDRPSFVKLCRQTLEEVKDDFMSDWVRIGMSCDFSNPYSTIEPYCVKTSQKSFVELYKKGLVTRKNIPSMWCVNCQTAIAQAELEDKELSSTFNDVKFQLAGGGSIIIATTRPELIPACVCLFAHPDDDRYKKLFGKKAIVPLFDYEVEIFPDESADPTKGSGIMMICSYGDRYDVDAIQRKKLEPRVCINKDGRMSSLAKQFAGMTIREARAAIIKALEEKGLLASKKNIVHTVNVHDKCQTEVEFLPTEQWFIKIMDNKQKFLDAGKKIKWHPESMRTRYDNWVTNLNYDWCVSRQRHFGVPFPIWYSKKTGEAIIADENELPVDPIAGLPKKLPHNHKPEDIIPEKDVMDTWVTSSLTPQIITNWIDDKKYKDKGIDFKEHYPITLRPQAHDIIRTWAFYTIVKGVYHHNMIPWEHIIISGNVADPTGEKMSKSKGNVVEPRTVIEKYCADALRFWAAGSKLGEDLAYQEKDLVTGKKFVNKLWNAGKFCYQHLEAYDTKNAKHFKDLSLMDRWLLVKFNQAAEQAADYFDKFNYSDARKVAEQFFWHTFCDNYLEVAKFRLYGEDGKARLSAQQTLYEVFLGILKIIAPIMPFITEELYQAYYADKGREGKKSIHLAEWPAHDAKMKDEAAEHLGELAINIIGEVRKYKASKQLSMKAELEKISVTTPLDLKKLKDSEQKSWREDILNTVKAKEMLIKTGKDFKVEIN